ncbi:hypothetical protein [Dyella sp.]|uniref:hypothetical protein n=1 Tax=Dyella sp. TaxID=1869338 RepID=UPI003F823EEC
MAKPGLHSMSWRRLAGSWPGLVACLLLGAWYAVTRGQDASWDLRNYHLYNAWALLHGRLGIDLAPASLQGYFNPLLDLPYYSLGTGPLRQMPRLLAACQGLWFGGVVWVVGRIVARLAALQHRPFGLIDAAVWLLGVSGSMTLSQAGLSSNEMPLALLVLGALYLLLPSVGDERVLWKRVVGAGALCGVAAGLKPTAIVYVPGLILALLIMRGVRRPAWSLAAVFSAAAASGFALAYGWWGWRLYQLTGNPVFPLFNQVFHSPWVPAASGTDPRFLPHGILQWLGYPFYWLVSTQSLVTEERFADPRYALALASVVALMVAGVRGARRGAPVQPQVRLIALFVGLSYVAWLVLFSILRYAIAIEVLSGVLMLMAWQAWVPSLQTTTPSAPGRWALVMLCIAAAAATHVPQWGHTRYASEAFSVRAPAVEPGSLVVVLGQPNAYVIPFIPDAADARFVGITWLTRQAVGRVLGERVRDKIAAHRGPLYAVLRDDAGDDLATLLRWLPGHSLQACVPVASAMERTRGGADVSFGLRLCRLESR